MKPTILLIATFSLLVIGMSIGEARTGKSTRATYRKGKLTLTQPNGEVATFASEGDLDEDGIADTLEVNGFIFSVTAGLQPWDGDESKRHFITDPLRWSTDGDPYSDYTEATGVNMHGGVPYPESHPIVAARPVIRMELLSYDVIEIGEITDTEGGNEEDSFTNTTSSQHEVGGSVTVGVEAKLSPFELASASVEVTASYSHTWSTTKSSTSTIGRNWSRARSTNPSTAARLKLRVFMENIGSAPAFDVQPEFNLRIGEKLIATIKPAFTQNQLNPGARSDEIIIERYDDGNGSRDITVTLDELKALQNGAPLSLVVTQVNAQVPRWNSETESFESNTSWSGFEGNIDPVVVAIDVSFGDGEEYYYQVFAGTRDYEPGFTMRDMLSLLFEVESQNGQDFIDGIRYPDEWYLSGTEGVVDEWNKAGRPQNMMQVPLRSMRARNSQTQTVLTMNTPGSEVGPQVNFATFTPDFRHVLVSAFPRAFPILAARAVVTIDGEEREVVLRQDGAFLTNETPFAAPADPNGIVYVEDVRGDITSKNTVLPGFYTSARDVIDFSSFLPVPGGEEYLLFLGGDTTRPAVIYCDFAFDEGQNVVGKEYVTLASTDSTNFSDSPARVFFNKIRLDVNTLEVDTRDLTFSDAGGQFVNTTYGYSSLSCSQHAGNIDLQGTPFHLDPFTDFEGNQLFVMPARKRADWYGGSPQSCIVAGVRGALKLLYDVEVPVPVVQDGLAGGGSLAFNIATSQNDGHINMGSGATLAVSNAMTLEAWVQPELAPGLEEKVQLLLNREGEYEIFRWSDGTIRWAIANGSPGWISINTYYRAPLIEWVHVALTYDRNAENGAIKTYINGRLFHGRYGSGAIGDHPTHANQDEFWIGSRQAFPQDAFTGLIDEVRVWNTVRTEQQLREAMTDTLGPEIYADANSGLIGYWRFDRLEDLGVGGDGADDVRDFSVNANHGDLVGDVATSDNTTSVEANEEVPRGFVIDQNYPNPFNPSTTISYALPGAGNVTVRIFNMRGQLIHTLLSSTSQPAGNHRVLWHGDDSHGQQVSSGVYLYRIEFTGQNGENWIASKKMLLMR
jgi:hypothetical protein